MIHARRSRERVRELVSNAPDGVPKLWVQRQILDTNTSPLASPVRSSSYRYVIPTYDFAPCHPSRYRAGSSPARRTSRSYSALMSGQRLDKSYDVEPHSRSTSTASSIDEDARARTRRRRSMRAEVEATARGVDVEALNDARRRRATSDGKGAERSGQSWTRTVRDVVATLIKTLTRELPSTRRVGVARATNRARSRRLVGDDGHLDLDARFDGDGRDLLHDVSRGVQIDQTLVNAHLESIPGVGTFTARRLANRQAKRWSACAPDPSP